MTVTPEIARPFDWSSCEPSYALAGTGWQVWGVGMLRSAGFPVSGLHRIGARSAADAAALTETGATGHEDFVARYESAYADEAARLAGIAGDERVRTAIAWQNRGVYRILDSLVRGTAKGAKRRERERTLAMYWMRYGAKADTIGFFGPASWISVGQEQRALDFSPGPSLIADSRVFLERWAVAALAEWMTAQPGARWWFPPVLRPDVHLDGDRLTLPGGRSVRLRDDEVQVLRQADGERHAQALVDVLVAEQGWEPASAGERVDRALNRLLRQRVLSWDANIPVDLWAEETLRRRVAAIGDPVLFVRLDAVLTELAGLRDDIGRAAASEELTGALDRLDTFFVRTTGQSASREEGKTYAGRTLCFQDTVRDCRTRLGRDFFDPIARPLAVAADAADWFGDRLARLVEDQVAGLVRRAAARHGTVTLADVWPQVLGMFWGDDPVAVRTATRELAEKWREVIALDPADERSARVRLPVDAIEDRARAAFAVAPGRPRPAAVHSPDLQVVARSVEAVNSGDFTVVLGEMHACLATLDLPFLEWTADGESLRDKVNRAVGAPRMVPLLPTNWRRNSGRMVPAPIGEGDRLIGFTRAPFGDRTRVDPAAAVVLAEEAGTVTATTPDGRVWSIPELLGVLVSIIAADAFKIGLDRAHTPRVTLDKLVLFRETWRLPAEGIGLAAKADRHADYLAVRRWVSGNGLPDRAFVKFPEETKPSLADFTSPALVLSFANTARRALRHDPSAVVTISEPLPDPDDSWLPDGEGERYVSELRLQISRKVPE
ncbi:MULTISPECIES: lantibiotic dehydratase [unclassified Streptomyces]|uniref:lantibiotic dehydratase n=1 Tax=unclassified Streptomyces TaxID=2593676 RepID=UPI000CD59A06|nr:lantibiotic dehydratase [Streptomyces sp. SM10]